MVRINLILISIALMLVFVSPVLANCTDDYATLKNFYEASKLEDYSSYIALIDVDYVYNYLADEQAYKDYVTAAWDVYDIKSYSLKLLKCTGPETGSILFFNAQSIITHDETNNSLDRDYVAVFENGKIQFVMDMDTFSLHQTQAYALQYYNQTKDIVNEEITKAQQMANYVANTDALTSKKRSNTWWIILLIIVLVLLVLKFRKKLVRILMQSKKTLVKQPVHKKVSDLSKKTVSGAKKTVDNTKKYFHAAYTTATPHIKKGISKAKEYSKTGYEKAKPLAQKLGKSTKDAAKTATKVAKKVYYDVAKEHKKK